MLGDLRAGVCTRRQTGCGPLPTQRAWIRRTLTDVDDVDALPHDLGDAREDALGAGSA